MLRLVRLRPGHQSRAASAARGLATETSLRKTVDAEPYGTAYGSGPSRIPYEPQRREEGTTPEVELSTASAASSARRLRKRLDGLHGGSFARLALLLHALYGPEGSDLSAISRLELHTILHKLARNYRTRHIAVNLLLRVLNPPSTSPRRLRISRTTLLHIFDSHYSLPRFKDDSSAALQPSGPLQQLFDCLAVLERSDNPRPAGLYEVIIQRCMTERLPDRAAKVYAELVEEWATTGMIPDEPRIASEAPPGALAVAPRRGVPVSLKSWWKNVRTWSLPGEVLSPLDRQDLWHPRKSAIGKRLRGFPVPSSHSSSSASCPPASLLLDILSGLHLDPKQSNNTDYTASMRALAILANPIFSRTIPVTSLGPLLRTLKITRRDTPVFPEDLSSVPEGDKWAYEAYTQIHLALQSVLFSPPLSASALQQVEREAIGELKPPSLGLRPLTWRICNILVDYTLKILREPKILKRLFNHMSEAFGVSAKPTLHNKVLQIGTAAREPGLANWAMQGLFGSSPVSEPPTKSDNKQAFIALEDNQIGLKVSQALPDEQSMVALLGYLASVREFDKVERLVYSLFPSLHTRGESGAPRNQQLEGNRATTSLELSPRMAAAVLAALEKAGKVSLAFRVYCLARRVEEQHLADIKPPSTRSPSSYTPRNRMLPIQAYTSMLQIWASETRGGAKRYTFPMKTLPILSDRRRLSRYDAAPLMAFRTHSEARERWRASFSNIQPDGRYFLALLSACRHRWMLDDVDVLPLDLTRRRKELEMVMEDMEQYDIPVPPIVKAKLGLLTIGPADSKKWSRGLTKGLWTKSHQIPSTFAANLAAMQMGWEHQLLVTGKTDHEEEYLTLSSREEQQHLGHTDVLTSPTSHPATSTL